MPRPPLEDALADDVRQVLARLEADLKLQPGEWLHIPWIRQFVTMVAVLDLARHRMGRRPGSALEQGGARRSRPSLGVPEDTVRSNRRRVRTYLARAGQFEPTEDRAA